MTYDSDTGIKGPILVLNTRNQLRTFKLPLPRQQKVKKVRLSKRRTPPISGQKLFSRWCPLIRELTVLQFTLSYLHVLAYTYLHLLIYTCVIISTEDNYLEAATKGVI